MVGRLDRLLFRLALALLAVIATLPFVTRLIGRYHANVIAVCVYAAVIAIAALLLAAMAGCLLARPSVRRRDVPRAEVGLALRQAVAVAVVFAASVPLALASPVTAEYSWLLAVPLRRSVGRQRY
ncbi:hypothetical protein [Streptomyces noursei]|uniref:hypothetical protein n=1 Tax=Streptomyces noursei TaxID=1971 RepID=UPI001675E747|nr:hypothetical protein [Streptomyces noursei]MCZ1014107.1 hypothetical protein [Streptomyces noursei]GGX50540.1 hypothetical protein GCM10010341_85190 [Streptomyces noursei]